LKKNIDIKNLKTAKRYALALAQSAIDNIDEVNENLAVVNDVVFNNADFVNFFSHPVVSLKDKKEALNEALEGKVAEKTLSFLNILLDENRFNIFKTIYELFKSEIDLIKNKQRVYVTSAISLDETQKDKLRDKLVQKLNKEVVLIFEENQDILGGLLIKFEDKVIDLSLKTKFENLRKSI
jgi:F-type H+-transporting ATPase subunit delta